DLGLSGAVVKATPQFGDLSFIGVMCSAGTGAQTDRSSSIEREGGTRQNFAADIMPSRNSIAPLPLLQCENRTMAKRFSKLSAKLRNDACLTISKPRSSRGPKRASNGSTIHSRY